MIDQGWSNEEKGVVDDEGIIIVNHIRLRVLIYIRADMKYLKREEVNEMEERLLYCNKYF